MGIGIKTAVGLATVIGTIGLPSDARAEFLVPPGNSAATQYTESVPTAGGQRDVERQTSGAEPRPRRLLGQRKVRQLESEGRAGREAAEFAAETLSSPTPSVHGKGQQQSAQRGQPVSAVPDGSSGALEAARQAAGASGGSLGPFLPLAILATAAWAIVFLIRRRRREPQS